ncbi:MAG: hypothetical protein WCJ64_25605 [Rhodospirillaceae bacterium]
MAVRPRIKTAQPLTEADETIVSAIINRGGAPATHESPAAPVAVPPPAPPPQPVDAEKKFTLRLPASLLAEIEKDAKDRPDRISVNTWLIGAALQRLNRGEGR